MRLPGGYEELVAPGARGFAAAEARGWAASVLADGSTLHGWAGRQPGAEALRGRGVAWRIASPLDDGSRWVVRHYRRGGWMAPLLGDRYPRIGTPRPVRELRAAVAAAERGVPTAPVVAGATYPDGPFRRADLVTGWVPHDADLAGWALGRCPPPVGSPAWAEGLRIAGRLVRTMEDAGVVHADLNARNVLLGGGPGAEAEESGPSAAVIDLDRCRILPRGAPPVRGPMRARLVRSLAKIAAGEGRAPPARAIEALGEGWGDAP